MVNCRPKNSLLAGSFTISPTNLLNKTINMKCLRILKCADPKFQEQIFDGNLPAEAIQPNRQYHLQTL